jgi:hypothetical protein
MNWKTATFVPALLFVMASTDGFAQMAETHDSVHSSSQGEFGLQFRSIQCDGVYFFYVSGVAGSIDLDLLQHVPGPQATLGIRAGVETYHTVARTSEATGSSYLDYNLLLRSTVEAELLRYDVYAGYTYHNSQSTHSGEGLFKCGIEIKYMLIPHIAGILFKASGGRRYGVIGAGFTVGISR